MAALTIPNIFFNIWFWFALIVVIIVINFFWGKSPPPPPKPSKFFAKHKKTITRITDIFLIVIILLALSSLVDLLVPIVRETVLDPPSDPKIQALYLRFSWFMFLMFAMCVSGWLGMLVGLLSVFQSNLTKAKRTILLVVCLLPVLLTILTVAIDPYEESRSILRLGLLSSFACWLVNGPALLMGKPWPQTIDSLLQKLRLAPKEHNINDSSP
ncbi:MAG: hypothetical protein KAY65_06145 [Planctomycetes bacterium]|nr:hypothetical protein [Planctomycetota bacterium]